MRLLWEQNVGGSNPLAPTIWYVDSRVADGKAVLVAPKEPLPISRVCHDPDVMQRVYDIGRKAGEETLSNKPEFIKEA